MTARAPWQTPASGTSDLGSRAAATEVRMPRLRAFTRAKVGGLPGPFWLLWSGTPINRIGYLVEPFLAYTTLPLAMRLQGLSSSYGRSVRS